MQYYGLTLNLKDDPRLIARYREHHRHPWPEPLQGLRQVGVVDMKIFLLGRRLFMYVAAEDGFEPARDFARYVESNPRAASSTFSWNWDMSSFHSAAPDEWWASMDLIFDLQEHLEHREEE